MADDLDDDWYVKEDFDQSEEEKEVEGNQSDQSGECNEGVVVEEAAKKSNGKKRSHKQIEEDPAVSVSPKQEKKKRKKKNKKNKLENEEDDLNVTAESLWDFFQTELKKTLSELEMVEIAPNDDWYLEGPKDYEKDDFSTYLKNCVTGWEEHCQRWIEKKRMSSPIMLIICPGGMRSVDMLRKTKEFRGRNCRCAKLFAKHLKLSEQMKMLSESVVHLGVGTPNRIQKLIEEGALNINRVKYVIIDWSWQDTKKRRIMNMHGVKEDLLTLFEKHIFPTFRAKKRLKIGCF